MNGITYGGGRYEESFNEILGAPRIKQTAQHFRKLVAERGGKYEFGSVAKMFVPNRKNWENGQGSDIGFDLWEVSVAGIPQAERDKLTTMILENLTLENPTPMVLKVGQNVDNSHEVRIKRFNVKGQDYIGIHMLCPNSMFAPRKQKQPEFARVD